MKIVTDFPRKVKEIENLWIELSDGVKLAARIWLPEDAEEKPVPAILEYLPYRKRDGTIVRDSSPIPISPATAMPRCASTCAAMAIPTGLMHDEYAKQEQDDALEVIDWLAKQPWCTGKVGMIGISWGGFNGLQVAARKPAGAQGGDHAVLDR